MYICIHFTIHRHAYLHVSIVVCSLGYLTYHVYHPEAFELSNSV